MENRRIVQNSIITPDGTILISRHRHDYVQHIDKNGFTYIVDGGNEYLRRVTHKVAPYTENSIYEDASFEEIRKVFCRGGRGKDGKSPLTWVPMCEMNDGWLAACIDYNTERDMEFHFATELYRKEQQYRKDNNIKIEENE